MTRPLLALLTACFVLQACHSTPEPLALDERPSDFSLGVTVTAPVARTTDAPSGADQAPASPRRTARNFRPARYIVEPDGVLRASTGPGALPDTYPLQTRQLSPRQMDQVWRLVRDSNLLDPDDPARIDSPASFVASRTYPAALLEVSFSGTRRYLRVALDRSSEESRAAERITDRLAELAWVE